MIALLDVNVLVALFDAVHVHHEAAHEWFAVNRSHGWATCPLTENGLVRIISNPAYPGRRTTLQDAIHRLEQFRASGDHTFWFDDLTLRDARFFHPKHIGGHRKLTDSYLLALAVTKGGRLATFDRGITLASVRQARPEHLELISSAGP